MALHPHKARFSLSMVYTHAILVLHWSRITPSHWLFSSGHFVDFIYHRIFAGFGGARGVMVIVAGCGHGDTSSNPGPD